MTRNSTVLFKRKPINDVTEVAKTVADISTPLKVRNEGFMALFVELLQR